MTRRAPQINMGETGAGRKAAHQTMATPWRWSAGHLTLVATLAAALIAGGPVQAQPRTPQASAGRQALLLQMREQWDALPQDDRTAIQDSLVWLGLYNGVVDGAFGQRTADAIAAFEKRELLQPGAVIAGPGLAVLRATANAQKASVGFATIDDDATGARIGAPLKLLDQRQSEQGWTRLTSSRNRQTSLTLFTGRPEDGDLPEWYARATSNQPGRSIAYKVIRPDFAVVSGEDGGRRFFTRVAAGPDGLRGFTFFYPASAASAMDRVTIAITNSFVPFASQPGAPARPASPQGDTRKDDARKHDAQTAAPAAAPAAAVTQKTLAGVALLAANGRAVTATAAVRGCRDIRVGDMKATVAASDRQSGLSLLNVDGLNLGQATPLPIAADGLANGRVTLAAFVLGQDGKPTLTALGGEAAPGDASRPGALRAALQPGSAGAVALDAQGALAGMAASLAPSAVINGVHLAAHHQMAGVADLTRILNDARAALAPASSSGAATSGAAIASWRNSLAPVRCM